jgi:hypothetical protein
VQTLRSEISAHQHDDPEETHNQPEDAHQGNLFVRQPKVRDDDREQWHRAVEDGGQRRIDPRLAPRDQSEWDRGIEDPHEDECPQGPRIPRQGAPL